MCCQPLVRAKIYQLAHGDTLNEVHYYWTHTSCPVKVIPQYCAPHPVLRITKSNWLQNIMAAFLVGKLVREKNGRFGKAWLGKAGGNLWQRGKESWAKMLKSLKVQNSRPFFLEHGGIFSNKGKPQQVRWSFPLKRAWWPIFFIT